MNLVADTASKTSSRETNRSSFGFLDLFGHLLIVALSALLWFGYLRTSDIIYDARYAELARSLVEHGSYQFDFRPETLLPPGLPLIIAFAWMLLGQSQAVMFHIMAVSTTLGMSAAFELLRRAEGRTVAIVSCLLLASSAALFNFATTLVFSDMPYYFNSMLVLLLALLICRSGSPRPRAGWIALCSLAVIMAVITRSAGVALLAGLAGWLVFSFLRAPGMGWHRLRLFCVPLLVGLATQALWSVWESRHRFEEWSVPGYPKSYLEQLKVKNGNEPQLGFATLRDIPPRMGRNLDVYAVEFVKLLSRKIWVNPYWCSPVVTGVIALILIGLVASLWNAGQWHDWYFLAYAAMYAVWPWNFELRFLLPAVPLACLYLWRGGKVVRSLVAQRSQIAGVALLLGGGCLALASLRWVVHTHLGQALLSLAFWSMTALVGIAIFLPAVPLAPATSATRRVLPILRIAGIVLLVALVGKGVTQQVQIAHSNLHFDTTKGVFFPSVEAGQWIAKNAPPEAVVMARKQDLIFHYSRHHVIWFPPTADARLLMEGIRKYQISLIVVPDSDDGYWRPSDQVCFQALAGSYPGDFRLVHRGAGYSVFAVDISGS